MSEKKELSNEELENVTGGISRYYHKGTLKFEYNNGDNIMAKLESCYASSTITSRGYYEWNNAIFPCYYLDISQVPDASGWYAEWDIYRELTLSKVTKSVTVCD